MDPDGVVPAVPAATVVPLRDGPTGLETLMLRRSSRLEFAGGMWVWPGGRIDPDDYTGGTPSDDPVLLEQAARAAAVREAREEADLVVDPDSLVWFSHWTPPPISPRRFATWFFAAPAPEGRITVDGGEIREHAWWAPTEALRLRNALEIELTPPTWITLEHLKDYPTVAAAMADLTAREAEHFATRFASVEGGAVALYHGDAGYDDEDPERPGPRHRLWMVGDDWRYERTS